MNGRSRFVSLFSFFFLFDHVSFHILFFFFFDHTISFFIQVVKDTPQQENGHDCGVFACKIQQYIALSLVQDRMDIKKMEVFVNQSSMRFLRTQMLREIFAGQIECSDYESHLKRSNGKEWSYETNCRGGSCLSVYIYFWFNFLICKDTIANA